MLKELHNISKIAVDNKFKVDDFETLTSLVEKTNKIKMYFDKYNSIINTIKDHVLHIFNRFSESFYGKLFLLIRSYLNIVSDKVLLTIKYIIEQTSSEFIKNKHKRCLQYYKYMTDTDFLDVSKQQKEELNNSLYDDDLIKQMYALNEGTNFKGSSELPTDWSKLGYDIKNQNLSDELEALTQMNDMMQNFSNMMKSGGLSIESTKMNDRKTRRLMVKSNKKSKKNK